MAKRNDARRRSKQAPQSAMTLEWSWKQLEAVFAAAHGISRESRPAFNAKLRHLQRSGVLPDTRLGRGNAATYGERHVIRVGFALELLQLGMTPENATAILLRQEHQILSEIAGAAANFAEGEFGESKPHMLIFHPRGLSYLQTRAELTSGDFIVCRGFRDYPLTSGRFSVLILDRFLESLFAGAASVNLCRPHELALALTSIADPQALESTRSLVRVSPPGFPSIRTIGTRRKSCGRYRVTTSGSQ